MLNFKEGNSLKVIETSSNNEPNDLMSIREISKKHGYDYNYLYKWSVIKQRLTLYDRGIWKLSEKEVLDFSRKRTQEKLAKLRSRKVGI